MINNYVKFMRGTPKAFNALVTKDNNTLYFISENDAASGKLYLGEKEIICDNNTPITSYLKDLLDVSLPEDISELKDGQVLTYDAETSTWVARDPSGVAEVLFDENQFELTENGELSIVNFANAESGAQLTKSADGKLVWIKPSATTIEGLEIAVETLREDVDSLVSRVDELNTPEEIDTKISEAIALANHLSYQIVDATTDIVLDAPGADKIIYLVKNGDIYDEYMVVNGALERVGDWNVDLSSYATKEEVNAIDTKVDDLAAQLNGVANEVENVKESFGNISTGVEGLGSRIDGLDSSVADLAEQLNAANKAIAENKASIETLTSALEAKVDLDVYNEKMASIDEDLTEMKTVMSWNQLQEPAE